VRASKLSTAFEIRLAPSKVSWNAHPEIQKFEEGIILCYFIRCIRVLVTEIFETISIASLRTHGCGEEAQLSLGCILIGSEFSSPNFNFSSRTIVRDSLSQRSNQASLR